MPQGKKYALHVSLCECLTIQTDHKIQKSLSVDLYKDIHCTETDWQIKHYSEIPLLIFNPCPSYGILFTLLLQNSCLALFCQMSQNPSSMLSSGTRVRVVSYNLLSSHLASPSHFTSCDPVNLVAETRLARIQSKLLEEINSPNNCKPIFCLQEVSQSWEGPLHVLFASHQYHVITGLYGQRFNNYMGVAIAYPTDAYTLVEANVARLSDHREGGWPRPPPIEKNVQPGIVSTLIKTGLSLWTTMVMDPTKKILGFKKEWPVSCIKEFEFFTLIFNFLYFHILC